MFAENYKWSLGKVIINEMLSETPIIIQSETQRFQRRPLEFLLETLMKSNEVSNVNLLSQMKRLVFFQWNLGVSNENLRVSNENLGVSNENLGISNEDLGIFNENLGISNENLGVSNENLRVSNENLRVSNEICGSPMKTWGLR